MFEQTGSFAKQQWRFEPANMKVYPAKSRYLSKLDLLLIKTEIGLKWGFYLDVPATGWLQSLLGSGIAVQFRFLVPRKTNGISIYELSYNWCIVDLKVVISIEDLYPKVDFRAGHGIFVLGLSKCWSQSRHLPVLTGRRDHHEKLIEVRASCKSLQNWRHWLVVSLRIAFSIYLSIFLSIYLSIYLYIYIISRDTMIFNRFHIWMGPKKTLAAVAKLRHRPRPLAHLQFRVVPHP